MKKIDLVTGFLGSGKTTFIKEYAEYLVRCGERVAIIVNDYGAINVDRLLLGASLGKSCHLEMVIGGDKDCTRRRLKTKLIAIAMQNYSRVILEPSGIFDVDDFMDMLYEEPLDRWYEMGSIISIVEADTEPDISESAKYVMLSELSKAGTLVLSKIDNIDNHIHNAESDKEVADKIIDYINKGLEEYMCSRRFSDIYIWRPGCITDDDFKRIAKSGYYSADMISSPESEKNFESLFFFHVETDLDSIQETIRDIFNDRQAGNVVRIKGFIRSDSGWLEINATRHGIKIEAIPEGQELFIVIGEGLSEEIIGKRWKSYRNGL